MCAYVSHALRKRKGANWIVSKSRLKLGFLLFVVVLFICLLLCADLLLPFFGRFGEAQAQHGGASFLGLEGFGCFTGGGAYSGGGGWDVWWLCLQSRILLRLQDE